MSFFQRTPFARLIIPLVCGIVFFSLVPNLHKGLLAGIFALSIVLISVSFFLKSSETQYRFRLVFGAGVLLFLFAFAYKIADFNERKSDFSFSDKKELYLAEIATAPTEKKNSFMCYIKLQGVFENSQWKRAKGNAVIYIAKDSAAAALLFGDRIMLQTQFSPPQKPLNPEAFDYGKYLKRQGVGAMAYIAAQHWKKSDENGDFSLFMLADRCRNFLLQIYRNLGLTGDEFAVVAALTLGYTDEIQPDLIAGYNATGAVHILSVSGLHVGIIYAFLLFLFRFLDKTKKGKIAKGVVIICFLWVYAFLTGLSPSVVRSAFMFSFVAFALCLGRKSQIYNSIFMSAFLMLIINPNNLYNIGFQLSYAAVLSIVFFSVPAHKVLKTNNKIAVWIWKTFIVSIAAQLGTAPFTIYYFHQFPNYFLLTNLIAIPLSTVIIYLAISTLALSFVPYLSTVLAFALEKMLWLLNHSILFLQNLPFSSAKLSLNFEQMWLVVAVILLFCIYYYSKRFLPLFVGLLCLLIAISMNIVNKYETLSSNKVLIYSGNRNTHISFINGKQNTVFTTDSAEIISLAKTFWDNNKLQKPDFIGETGEFSNGFISFSGKKFLILTDDILKGKTAAAPFQVDFLLIGAFVKPQMEQILKLAQPKMVIICSGVSTWYVRHIAEICEKNSIPSYSIAQNGAFLLDL